MPAPASSHLRSHLVFAALCAGSLALFWGTLARVARLSLDDQRYSHLILIPLISGFFLYREKGRIFSATAFASRFGAALLAGALAVYALLAVVFPHPWPDYALTVAMLSIALVWAAAFAFCYGARSLRAGMFSVLLLLLMVPIPFHLMDGIITLLQTGSAEATFVFFKLAGVPTFREGVIFELPGMGIEIAKECSSIHSCWALFITGLLVAHLFLQSMWTKTCLCLLTVPVAMLTNAVRIVTIWFLGTKVNVGFFYGDLHRNGGILFSLISLSLLMSFLWVLRKLEGRGVARLAQ